MHLTYLNYRTHTRFNLTQDLIVLVFKTSDSFKFKLVHFKSQIIDNKCLYFSITLFSF